MADPAKDMGLSSDESAELGWQTLTERINVCFDGEHVKDDRDLTECLKDEGAEDLSLAIENIGHEKASLVFTRLDIARQAEILSKCDPGLAVHLISNLSVDEFTKMLVHLPKRKAAIVASRAPREHALAFVKAQKQRSPSLGRETEIRLRYGERTAGRLMTRDFVRLDANMCVTDAIEAVRATDPLQDVPEILYVVAPGTAGAEHDGRLLGALSIRDLMMAEPHEIIKDIMGTELLTVGPSADLVDVARLVSKYEFLAVPIVDADRNLLGVIPMDDLSQATIARLSSLYNRSVGTDAEEMHQLSALGAAKKRVPWLLGTMVIELMAGGVVSYFDNVLKQIILLASFMPVISAISGNVGLQAAAITVRALDTGTLKPKERGSALARETATTFLMALVCGAALGIVGGVWSKHIPFGLVIGVALTCSMLTAGVMGTMIPMLSKRLGFDPATTAGPFETAFQDVIGFAVFLSLASLLLNWLT